jgi:hypothetical protein
MLLTDEITKYKKWFLENKDKMNNIEEKLHYSEAIEKLEEIQDASLLKDVVSLDIDYTKGDGGWIQLEIYDKDLEKNIYVNLQAYKEDGVFYGNITTNYTKDDTDDDFLWENTKILILNSTSFQDVEDKRSEYLKERL